MVKRGCSAGWDVAGAPESGLPLAGFRIALLGRALLLAEGEEGGDGADQKADDRQLLHSTSPLGQQRPVAILYAILVGPRRSRRIRDCHVALRRAQDMLRSSQ